MDLTWQSFVEICDNCKPCRVAPPDWNKVEEKICNMLNILTVGPKQRFAGNIKLSGAYQIKGSPKTEELGTKYGLRYRLRETNIRLNRLRQNGSVERSSYKTKVVKAEDDFSSSAYTTTSVQNENVSSGSSRHLAGEKHGQNSPSRTSHNFNNGFVGGGIPCDAAQPPKRRKLNSVQQQNLSDNYSSKSDIPYLYNGISDWDSNPRNPDLWLSKKVKGKEGVSSLRSPLFPPLPTTTATATTTPTPQEHPAAAVRSPKNCNVAVPPYRKRLRTKNYSTAATDKQNLGVSAFEGHHHRHLDKNTQSKLRRGPSTTELKHNTSDITKQAGTGESTDGCVTRQRRMAAALSLGGAASSPQRHKPASTRSNKLKNVENNSPLPSPATMKPPTRRCWEEHQQAMELTCKRSKYQHNIQARRSRAYKRQQRMSAADSTGDDNMSTSEVEKCTCGCESTWQSRLETDNRAIIILRKLPKNNRSSF